MTNLQSYLGWKVKKAYLTWSAKQGIIFQPAWNLTFCNIDFDMGFKPELFGRWSFRIGM